jgi:hypothetical protein
MKRELSEPVKIVLRKQCEIVGADFDKLDFVNEESRWFMEYSWNSDQRKEFGNWMKKYLKECPISVWREFNSYSRNKTNIDKFIEAWIFNFGWMNIENK